jgi:hypothetical protein
MEREISMAVEISVALIALSAFIGILWFTVAQGEGLANSVSMESNQIFAVVESGQLEGLTQINSILPTSAVYSIIRPNENVISHVNCKICGRVVTDADMTKAGKDLEEKILEVGKGKCLLQHLNGKVSLEVEFNNIVNAYILTVHKQDCGWYGASCTGTVCP